MNLACILLCLTAQPAVEPLVYERFEEPADGVTRAAEVVGHGGLEIPNAQSGQFDGSPAGAIDLGTARRLTATDFTVECFVRPAATGDYQALASCWNEEGDQRGWALVILPGGGLRFDISPDGLFYRENVLSTAPLLRTGRWYHVAAMSQANTSILLVNGREVARLLRPIVGQAFQPDGELRPESPTGAHLKLAGADCYAGLPRGFHGLLDEVRITPRALAAGELLRTREAMPEVRPPGQPEDFVMPFAAKCRAETEAWQAKARARLFELVAQQEPRADDAAVPLDLQWGEPLDRGEYLLYPASYQSNSPAQGRRQGLLAVPKPSVARPPLPAMLCLHGHGGTAEAVFDGAGIYRGMADRFARGGYVAFAPSLPHRDYAAMNLWDLLRAVDILAERPEVDPRRIGVAGLSMGGEWTMWAAACDQRFRVAVVSGWMCTTEGVYSVPNCPCWELPGLVELMDICEVHLLIAPRAVVFESAAEDGCFPIAHSRAGFARIQAGYGVFGAADQVVQDVWPAGHEWHGAVAYPVVDRVLGGRAAGVASPNVAAPGVARP